MCFVYILCSFRQADSVIQWPALPGKGLGNDSHIATISGDLKLLEWGQGASYLEDTV